MLGETNLSAWSGTKLPAPAVLRRDPVWSNRALQETAQRVDGVTEMAIQEVLLDRYFVMELLDSLPKCSCCGKRWITQFAFVLVDLSEEQEVYGICDDCPLPQDVLHVRVLPHARALRELVQRRYVWDQDEVHEGGAETSPPSEEPK